MSNIGNTPPIKNILVFNHEESKVEWHPDTKKSKKITFKLNGELQQQFDNYLRNSYKTNQYPIDYTPCTSSTACDYKNVSEQHLVFANGMTATCAENKNARSISFGIKFPSGHHQNGEKSGIAHLVEHLIYSTISNNLQNLGGKGNAVTIPEATIYYFEFPLSTSEKQVSEFIQNLFSSVTNYSEMEKVLEQEKVIVHEEVVEKSNQAPFTLAKGSCCKSHPFGDVYEGGIKDTLSSITINDIEAYIKSHYLPTGTSFLTISPLSGQVWKDILTTSLHLLQQLDKTKDITPIPAQVIDKGNPNNFRLTKIHAPKISQELILSFFNQEPSTQLTRQQNILFKSVFAELFSDYEGSLKDLLHTKQYISPGKPIRITSDNYSSFGATHFYLNLTQEGFENYEEIVRDVFNFFEFITNHLDEESFKKIASNFLEDQIRKERGRPYGDGLHAVCSFLENGERDFHRENYFYLTSQPGEDFTTFMEWMKSSLSSVSGKCDLFGSFEESRHWDTNKLGHPHKSAQPIKLKFDETTCSPCENPDIPTTFLLPTFEENNHSPSDNVEKNITMSRKNHDISVASFSTAETGTNKVVLKINIDCSAIGSEYLGIIPHFLKHKLRNEITKWKHRETNCTFSSFMDNTLQLSLDTTKDQIDEVLKSIKNTLADTNLSEDEFRFLVDERKRFLGELTNNQFLFEVDKLLNPSFCKGEDIEEALNNITLATFNEKLKELFKGTKISIHAAGAITKDEVDQIGNQFTSSSSQQKGNKTLRINKNIEYVSKQIPQEKAFSRENPESLSNIGFVVQAQISEIDKKLFSAMIHGVLLRDKLSIHGDQYKPYFSGFTFLKTGKGFSLVFYVKKSCHKLEELVQYRNRVKQDLETLLIEFKDPTTIEKFKKQQGGLLETYKEPASFNEKVNFYLNLFESGVPLETLRTNLEEYTFDKFINFLDRILDALNHQCLSILNYEPQLDPEKEGKNISPQRCQWYIDNDIST